MSSSSSQAASSSSSHLVAGAGAGFIATTLLHPLDLIKTRVQVQEASGGRRLPMYMHTLHAVRTIVLLEGVPGLYQGLLPNIVGSVVSWGLYMHFYSRCKESLSEHVQGSTLYLSAATLAGTVVTLIVHPIFMIKTRLQLQMRDAGAVRRAQAHTVTASSSDTVLAAKLVPTERRNDYKGMVDALRCMVRDEGALSLYRGLLPSMLLVSHGSIQFLGYEQIKTAARSRHAGGAADDSVLTPAELLCAGTLSKVLASLATYPAQVLRSCMQQRAVIGDDVNTHSRAGALQTAARIARAEGPRGLYRGIVPHLLRSTPQASITLISYEYILRAHQRLRPVSTSSSQVDRRHE